MRSLYFLVAALCLLQGCRTPLASFEWLDGNWSMPSKNGGQRIESWIWTKEPMMYGKGIKVTGKDSMILESIELKTQKGETWYIPTVPDQNDAEAIPFKLVKEEHNQFTFENPAHDFPQRIFYQYLPSTQSGVMDSMYVRVESLDGKGIDYRFAKVK